ncbi:MAG: hypothetical protein IKT38_01780 [Clostridia bacterium]|nr:hypothetical protein [Clostridia bacterium]
MEALQAKRSLLNADVTYLYHANTVVTALSFIKKGGLLSRQTADYYGMPQTPQGSDEIDKKFNVYNDIFFDSVDIHARAKQPNDYGPVMFVYSIDVLDSLTQFDIGITKDNPIYWRDGITDNEKYFVNHIEMLILFNKGDFNKHITIRDISVPLPFDYLEEIVIENPGEVHRDLLEKAKYEIENALYSTGWNVPVRVRSCPSECKCFSQYTEFNRHYAYHRFKTEL